jgi:hypothetical protein
MIPSGCKSTRLLHRVFNFHFHKEQVPEVEHRENQKEEQGRHQKKFDHRLALPHLLTDTFRFTAVNFPHGCSNPRHVQSLTQGLNNLNQV